MPELSEEKQKADVLKLHDYIKKNFNYEMKLFRYPAGAFSEQSLAVLQSLGYTSVFWSFAYADWDPKKANGE
ncbi:Polysaccharide deacetylase [Lachnospiraceae bacterium TWA4]|nr:Polysaccharide deacetylase [Lachnospiraceae bacterium TWA4]